MRLTAVGDIMLGDSPTTVGFGIGSLGVPDRSIGPLRDVAGGSGVVIGNLETVLTDREGGDLRSAQMRGPRSLAGALRSAGFTILNVANNHALQHGEGAFGETVEALEEAGIACCGLAGEEGWTAHPVIVEAPGESVGVLGYCLRPRQYFRGTPPFAEGDREGMSADVRRLRDRVDSVVVSLHWGEEFVSLPSCEEVTIAHALVEEGATLVVGHHPHVVRPVERYAQGLIAYSLGNLVSDMLWQRQLRVGLILSCELKSGAVEAVELHGTRVDRHYGLSIGKGPPEGFDGPVDAVACLDAATYEREVRRGLTRQRVAAYAYALRNVHRYPPDILRALAGTTARNKLRALLRPLRRGQDAASDSG